MGLAIGQGLKKMERRVVVFKKYISVFLKIS